MRDGPPGRCLIGPRRRRRAARIDGARLELDELVTSSSSACRSARRSSTAVRTRASMATRRRSASSRISPRRTPGDARSDRPVASAGGARDAGRDCSACRRRGCRRHRASADRTRRPAAGSTPRAPGRGGPDASRRPARGDVASGVAAHCRRRRRIGGGERCAGVKASNVGATERRRWMRSRAGRCRA